MSVRVTIEWGDGYVAVSPIFPEELTKKLRYWHRSLERDDALMRMVATGEFRELYNIQSYIAEDQQYVRKLVTMPGFVHRIKTALTEAGMEYTLVDTRTPAPAPDYVRAFAGLREYQKECAYVALASGGGIVACPTGWGKTHIISAIIDAYSHDELCARNTPLAVVATPEKDITAKDYEDLTQLLPEREVGIVMSGKKRFSDDVQVITLNSLHLLQADEIGLLIVDEVHTASSEKRSENLLAARKALKWGVSATPDGRFDGRDLVTEGLFGPIVYRRTYADGIADGALVPIKVFWIAAPPPHIGIDKYHNYKSRTGKYRNGVDRNQAQNQVIAEILRDLSDDYQTMCIMQHLDQMNQLVPLTDNVPCVHGQTQQKALVKDRYHNLAAVSAAERRETYAKMREGEIRQILSTHVYKQGVNFPQLEIVINAGGGGSDIVAKQIPGRESRLIEGKQESYLIDFWHNWDMEPDKKGRLRPGPIHRDDRSREKAYTQLGFEQVWLDRADELPFLRTKDGQN